MRYLVISDVHSNAPALEAVQQDAPAYDQVVCLGDIVGYGPDPNACVAQVRELEPVCLAGNHDWGAVGRADVRVFNHEAREALIWTQHQLTRSNRTYLQSLAPQQKLVDGILLAHGSPRDPVWEYLVDASSAAQVFEGFEFEVVLVGHSHLPLATVWHDDVQRAQPLRGEEGLQISLKGRRLILNPGSVGQPRDGNPKASYALLDTKAGTWVFRRIAYPVEATQARMRAKDLPQRLIDRLELGR